MTSDEQIELEKMGKHLLDMLHRCDSIMTVALADIRNMELRTDITSLSDTLERYLGICKDMREHISLCMRKVITAYRTSIVLSNLEDNKK